MLDTAVACFDSKDPSQCYELLDLLTQRLAGEGGTWNLASDSSSQSMDSVDIRKNPFHVLDAEVGELWMQLVAFVLTLCNDDRQSFLNDKPNLSVDGAGIRLRYEDTLDHYLELENY